MLRWFFIIIFGLLSPSLFCQIPTDFPGLKLWLRGDSNLTYDINNKVSVWKDSHDSSFSVQQAIPGSQPLYIGTLNKINYKPIIQFDGISSGLSSAEYLNLGTNGMTFFLVGRVLQVTSFGNFMDYGTTSTGSWNLKLVGSTGRLSLVDGPGNQGAGVAAGTTSVLDSNSFYIFSGYIDGSNSNFSISENGVQKDLEPHSGFVQADSDQIYIGQRNNAAFLNGQIAEIVCYNGKIADSAQQELIEYLRAKYAPPVNLGNDITVLYGFCDTVLQTGNRFLKYNWSVFDSISGKWIPVDSIHANISVGRTGKYAVQTQDAFGFWSSDTIKVVFPSIHEIAKTNSLCLGDTLSWDTDFNGSDYSFVWQDGSVQSGYDITLAGSYFVKVTDKKGCFFQSDTIKVNLDTFRNIASLGPDTSFCSGNSISLRKGASLARSYLWSTGASSPGIAIPKTDTYRLTVTDFNGCVAKDSIFVTIKGVAPIDSFSITSMPTCQNDSLTFINYSKDAVKGEFIADYLWDFGDKSFSSILNPKHLYPVNDTGKIFVKLTVTTSAGCSNVDSMQIHLYPRPQISAINYSSSFVCDNYKIKFMATDKLFGYPVQSYYWNFGAGPTDSSDLINPIHVFLDSGKYNVRMIITNNHGCQSDTLIKQVKVNLSPLADYTVSKIRCTGQEISILNNASSFPAIQTFKINFGDKSRQIDTATVRGLKHIYLDSGKYVVSIINSAVNGCVDTFKTQVNVHSLPLDTSFSIIGPRFCTNTEVKFSSKAYVFPPDSVRSVSWLIDGGAKVLTAFFDSSSFTIPGLHSVRLIVTSDSGCTDTSQARKFTINPLPNSGFSYSPVNMDPPLNALFKPDTSSNTYVYSWNFGDPSSLNNSSSLLGPAHLYNDTGNYIITLNVTNESSGCSSSTANNFHIQFGEYAACLEGINAFIDGDGFLNISVTLRNASNRVLTSADFIADIEGDQGFKEVWNGSLGIGDVLTYPLTYLPRLNTTTEHTYACISVENPDGYKSSDPSCGQICITLNNNQFTLPNPSPNPAVTGYLNIPVIVPANGLVQITLYSSTGQKITDTFQYSVSKGYNNFSYATDNLSQGVYIYIVEYNSSTASKRFIKLK